MHVISYRRLREFSKHHADCQDALDNWFKVASSADWSNLVEVHYAALTHPTQEFGVIKSTILNIKGNKAISVKQNTRWLRLRSASLHPERSRRVESLPEIS